MTTELEDCLRRDLPRLADLLLVQETPTPLVVVTSRSTRARRRSGWYGIGAAAAIVAIVGGYVALSSEEQRPVFVDTNDEAPPTTTETTTTTALPAAAQLPPLAEGDVRLFIEMGEDGQPKWIDVDAAQWSAEVQALADRLRVTDPQGQYSFSSDADGHPVPRQRCEATASPEEQRAALEARDLEKLARQLECVDLR